MGYFNPIYNYGIDNFVLNSKKAGVDGLIVVDLPPEADKELCKPALKNNIDFIRLATPITDAKRLKILLKNSSGFLYYISVLGITGTKKPNLKSIRLAIEKIRKNTTIPIAVGFGIRTPEQAAKIVNYSDAVVVGSAIVEKIGEAVLLSKNYKKNAIDRSVSLVKSLSDSVKKGNIN